MSASTRRHAMRTGRLSLAAAVVGLGLLTGSCSSPPGALLEGRDGGPRIVAAATPLSCVPFAREATGIPLMGDAWAWWDAAAKDYRRDTRPGPGSILVLRKTERLRRGHLAVVNEVVSSRVVLVDHANWLNEGQIHKGIPVQDVSAANDWSAVRVWYVPGNTLGLRVYPAYGFIHPQRQRAAAAFGALPSL